MKNIALVSALLGLLVTAGSAQAAGVPANIASPRGGATVANNFYSSFTVNCPPGLSTVVWFLDGVQIGKAGFIDTTGVHFAYKLAAGTHSLRVTTSCGGSDSVVFKVL